MRRTDETRRDTEAALLGRVRRGDVDAFEALCAEIEAPLFSYALRCVENRPDAEDVVQETLLRLFRAARLGKLNTAPRAYAFSVAHNLAVDVVRRQRRVVFFESPPAPSAARSAEQSLLRQQIGQALDDLPRHHRSALLLREFGGLSYAEIAQALDVSVGEVKVWIYRARKRLSTLVDRDGQYLGETRNGA